MAQTFEVVATLSRLQNSVVVGQFRPEASITQFLDSAGVIRHASRCAAGYFENPHAQGLPGAVMVEMQWFGKIG